jgi:hypothetical protein
LVRRPGFSTISVLPEALSTQAPSINILAWCGWLVMGRLCSVIDMAMAPGRIALCYVAMAIAVDPRRVQMLARLMSMSVIVTYILPRHAGAEQLRIFAAGSLEGAFTEMIAAFPARAGSVAQPVFGPSGLL